MLSSGQHICNFPYYICINWPFPNSAGSCNSAGIFSRHIPALASTAKYSARDEWCRTQSMRAGTTTSTTPAVATAAATVCAMPRKLPVLSSPSFVHDPAGASTQRVSPTVWTHSWITHGTSQYNCNNRSGPSIAPVYQYRFPYIALAYKDIYSNRYNRSSACFLYSADTSRRHYPENMRQIRRQRTNGLQRFRNGTNKSSEFHRFGSI